MKTLKEIHESFGPIQNPNFEMWPFTRTDKGDWHSYLPVYEELFSSYRSNPISLLEIGVLRGSSLALWSMYFESAKHIVGIDDGSEIETLINSTYQSDNTFKESSIPPIQQVQQALKKFSNVDFICPIDAYDPSTIEHLEKLYPGKFDIIIDDALHIPERQMYVAKEYGSRLLSSNGLLIIEDVVDSSFVSNLNLPSPYSASVRHGHRESDDLIIIKNSRSDT